MFTFFSKSRIREALQDMSQKESSTHYGKPCARGNDLTKFSIKKLRKASLPF
jgi:hypothetical protein